MECTNWDTEWGSTHIFHVVLYTILSEVRRGMDRVELSGGLDVRPLKMLLIDPELVGHLCAQIYWREQKQNSFNSVLMGLHTAILLSSNGQGEGGKEGDEGREEGMGVRV